MHSNRSRSLSAYCGFDVDNTHFAGLNHSSDRIQFSSVQMFTVETMFEKTTRFNFPFHFLSIHLVVRDEFFITIQRTWRVYTRKRAMAIIDAVSKPWFWVLRGLVVPKRSGSRSIRRVFKVRRPTPCGPINIKHLRAKGGIRATSW